MLTFGILLIIGGLLATAFGAVMNTILLSIFAGERYRGLQIERFLHEADFQIAWLFRGPGTIVMIIGTLVIVVGIALLVIRRKSNARQRQLNKNIKHTNKRRKQQGKRVRR
jgi:cell division protein FtsX